MSGLDGLGWPADGRRVTPETDSISAVEGNWDTRALRMTDHARKIERERDEARAIARDALSSFRITQRPEHYPQGHWSRRAQSLLENVTEHTTPRNED